MYLPLIEFLHDPFHPNEKGTERCASGGWDFVQSEFSSLIERNNFGISQYSFACKNLNKDLNILYCGV
jgi:hypothetical protein